MITTGTEWTMSQEDKHVSTQQMKLLIVNLLSFSQSRGLGTIPGIPHCINLPALVPVFVHCTGKQAISLVPRSLCPSLDGMELSESSWRIGQIPWATVSTA